MNFLKCYSLVFVFVVFSLFSKDVYSSNISKNIDNTKCNGDIDFKFSNKELEELSKWKNSSLDLMWEDAFKCDMAALYMGGMCFLTGSTGFTIDVQKADFCFSNSASFGFAPSIKQIIHTKIDEENLFLVLVYTNLICSLGHSEYLFQYHDLRSKVIQTFGVSVINEVERIVSCKMELINSNIQNLINTKDKNLFFQELITKRMLIDSEDDKLNQNYWIGFTKYQTDEEKYFLYVKEELINEFIKFDESLTQYQINFSKSLKLISNQKSFDEFKLTYIKDAKKAIQSVEDYFIFINKYKKTKSKKLSNLLNEYIYYGKFTKKIIEIHIKFYSNVDKFLESDDLINELEENTASLMLHKEKIFENLGIDIN